MPRLPASLADTVREHGGPALRYGVVGLSGYAISVALFAAQIGAGVLTYAAVPAGFVVNSLWNFTLNRRWSFPGSGGSWQGDLARFALIALGSLAANYMVLFGLHDGAGLPPVPSQALSILAVIPLGYLGQRYWAFRRR